MSEMTLKGILERVRLRQEAGESERWLEEAENLCRVLAEVDGWSPAADVSFQQASHPRALKYWLRSCAAFSFLLGVDLENLPRGPAPRP